MNQKNGLKDSTLSLAEYIDMITNVVKTFNTAAENYVVFLSYRLGRFGQGIRKKPVAGHRFCETKDYSKILSYCRKGCFGRCRENRTFTAVKCL